MDSIRREMDAWKKMVHGKKEMIEKRGIASEFVKRAGAKTKSFVI